MSLQSVIPKADLDQLLCSSCSNCLSVFPVYLTRNNAGAICGRCTPYNQDTFIRDEAYEAIAQFLLFPCCYKKNGCEEELTPQKLVEHEIVCSFRKFECISKTYTSCPWLGARSDMLQHFEQHHPNLLLKYPEFNWDFGASHRENLLLSLHGSLFIVKREFDGRKQNFSCSVQIFCKESNVEHYTYTVTLLSNKRGVWFRLPKKSMETEEAVVVNSEDAKEKLNDPAFVIIQIEISKADKTEARNSSENASVDVEKNSNLNWDLLHELECPVCYDIMLPPIYQCTDGHSFCEECKITLEICPLCRSDIFDTRNFTMEKMTIHLTYPCKFYKSGCKHISKSSEIKKHEENCKFGPYECPLMHVKKCQMKINRFQMAVHVKRNHNSFVLKSNRITSPFNLEDVRECFYFMIYSENVFTVRYNYKNQKFYWTVQLVGPEEECGKFKFEIDVIDNSKNKLRCYLNGLCASTQKNITNIDSNKCGIMLTYEQLRPFIRETLDYNIYITQD